MQPGSAKPRIGCTAVANDRRGPGKGPGQGFKASILVSMSLFSQTQAVDVLMLCADREEETPKRAKRSESSARKAKVNAWEGDMAQCCQAGPRKRERESTAPTNQGGAWWPRGLAHPSCPAEEESARVARGVSK